MAECDGGCAGGDAGGAAGDAGGAAAAASGASSASADGTSSADVLGNCAHGDGKGYLGDGCFHVPVQCAVPFHRWEIGNGGSKRKKTKKGKDKKYAYEKGMKVVIDMLHERKMSRVELDDFYKALQDGEVEFDYVKKDGSKRHAHGTLDPKLMPSREEMKKIYAQQDVDLDALEARLQARKDYMPYYWDLDKGGYRQFHVSRFEGVGAPLDTAQMIAEWNDTHIPRGRVNRHETGIPVKYWVAVDDYSELLNNYSCFVDWSLNLTPLANNHRPTFLTVDPSKVKELAKRAIAKWPDKYVFVGVDDSSRGMQTQKNHLRASVKYFWSPKYKMWNDALTFNEAEDLADDPIEAVAGAFKKYDGKPVDWEAVTELASDDDGSSHIWLKTPDGILVCRIDPDQPSQKDSEPSAYYIVDKVAGKLVEVGNGYPQGFTTFHFDYQPAYPEDIPADMPTA